MSKIGVLGSGTWGTALSVLLLKNGHEVVLWSFMEEEAKKLRDERVHPSLPGSQLPDELVITSDIASAISEASLIVMAVPSIVTRETAERIKDIIKPDQPIVVVSKGIEENTLFVQTEIIEDVIKDARTAVLSGPSHAEEVIKSLPTVVVAGSKDKSLALFIQETFMNPEFRVYESSDVKGIELGGSLKNVIALAAGMSDGLGYGDNAKAALITRGVHEMSALAVACGADPSTLSGLTGIGDLIVTCDSMHSRNRRAGILIGQGKTMEEATKEVKMVVEGVYSAKAALALGKKYNVTLPIMEAVNKVLFDGLPCRDAVYALMCRERKSEF
ncbi:MAG: NAD(P)-dependent glycerol-3-phosphate dehydrogenase [Lachnospiraceae bacterium]|nr:NAD(P)-dependent glycerol-3-phosphate dehydrogenase [Lachnospiraceae bacterium]